MPLEGLQNGRYRVLRSIGSGGMGEVFLAEDTRIGRQVAIKVIRTESSPYPEADPTKDAVRLFLQEAKTIAIFNHPNILPLYDFGEENNNGTPLTYMVMPYCPDGSLTTWLQNRNASGSLSTQDVVHFIEQAANALQHAHDRSIVHRDVKPSNFLLRKSNNERPDLLLADFGIAKLGIATTTASRTIRGTPTYMAPELWTGNPVPASDQYALAVMAYEMLTGRPPFQGGLEQMMYQHIYVQPHSPSKLNSRLSQDIDAVFGPALAKRPEERFLSIAAFSRALQKALSDPSAKGMPTALSSSAATMASNEIRATLAISPAEARSGTRRNLTLPDGRQMTVVVPAGMINGGVLRLEAPSGASSTGGALLLNITVTDLDQAPVTPYEQNAAPTVITPPPPPPASIRPAAPRQGISKTVLLVSLVLVLLVAAGSGTFLYFAKSNPAASPTPTGTIQAQNQGTPTSAIVTPTSTPIQTTPSPTANNLENPYTHSGTLLLNDPLSDNSKGYNWQTGTNARNASCTFSGGAYHVTQPAQGFFHSCTAYNTDFSNFAFEVQMNMISGDYAGIIFCQNTPNQTYYFYRVSANGDFMLMRNIDANFSNAVTLATGSISINQTNVIAVVATGGAIDLYMNRQFIKRVYDNNYTRGQIAVFTGNDGHSAETVFSNAKVWSV